MAYDPYQGMFYPTLPEDTQDFPAVLSGVGRSLRDFGRGVSYYPMDLAGAVADIGNLPLQGIDYLVNQIRGTDQNYISTDRPFGGSAQLIDAATRLGLSQQPTGSAPETIGRVMAGLINPMAGARAVGRVGDITTEQANRAADALVRQITGNPQATAPAVLEAAGGMVPLSRMFKPEQVKAILPETKAVDASGNPVMVYHGTADPIEQFSKSKLGESTRAQSAKQGFFFQDNPSYARNYADYAANEARVQTLVDKAYAAEKKGDWDGYDKFLRQAEELESSFRKDYGAGQNIYPAYLDMKNPFVFDAKGESYTYIEDSLTNIIKKAKKQGHDGVIFRNLDDIPGKTDAISDHYVVFEPEQIKSAVSDPAFTSLLEPKTSKFEMPSFASLRPETTDDIDKIYDYLEKQAKKSGFRTESGASNVSNSRYLTIEKDLGNDEISTIEVRISAHEDRHPFTYATDGKISIDPSRGGVDLETTLWDLQEKGYDLIK